MLEEIQQLRQTENNLKMVWWIPADYWEVAIGEKGIATQEQINYIKGLLEEYTIVIAGDYTLGSDNTTDFKINKLSKDVVLFGLQGEKIPQLKETQIDEQVLSIINDILKPLFSNMAGKMGAGFSFFVYKNKIDGKLIIDPRKSGSFRVEIMNDVFKWQLPLVSMMTDKICPVSLEVLPGNYMYCPHHGNKL